MGAVAACGSSAAEGTGDDGDAGTGTQDGGRKAPSDGGTSAEPDSGGTGKDSGSVTPGDAGGGDGGGTNEAGSADGGVDASRVTDAGAADAATCSSYLGDDCGDGLDCYLGSTGAGIAGYCHAPGTVQPGGVCTYSSDCTPHSVCLNPGTCFALCAYPGGACPSNKTCADFGLPGLGYCVTQ